MGVVVVFFSFECNMIDSWPATIYLRLLVSLGDKKSNVHAYFDEDDTMTATISSEGEDIVVEVR